MMNTTQTLTAPVATSAACAGERDMQIAAIAQTNRSLFDTLVEAMRSQNALA